MVAVKQNTLIHYLCKDHMYNIIFSHESLTHKAKSHKTFLCRGYNDADPMSVITARKTEADIIAQWVKTERTRLQLSP